ncbi:hypothetical protein [Pseudonocardia sp. D17]|uniref:hypothetical protein n=1 Tax=Pseudonocardia sp. D17 TaxID=882661 RepID=UPI002B3707B6|nr:hypothetical protein PSD17_57990 [Pseudonocardia sp. D17]
MSGVEAGPSRVPRALRPFRRREYRLLVSSMAASLLATAVWLVAIVWQVIALGGGPAQLSVVAAANSGGLLLSVLVGGVAADRLGLVLCAVEAVRLAPRRARRRCGGTGRDRHRDPDDRGRPGDRGGVRPAGLRRRRPR